MKLTPGLNSSCSAEGWPLTHEVGGDPTSVLLDVCLAQLGLILCAAASSLLTMPNRLHVHQFLISIMQIIIPT